VAVLGSGGIYVGLEEEKAEEMGQSAFPPSNPVLIPPLSSIATSALKMETVCFSETLASNYDSTRRQNPEPRHHHPHRH
jgi:hypothetical protein